MVVCEAITNIKMMNQVKFYTLGGECRLIKYVFTLYEHVTNTVVEW